MSLRFLSGLVPTAVRERAYTAAQGRRSDRWRSYPGIERIPPGGHAVVTFDDGPDIDSTPRILDILREMKAQATFFVVGEQMELHPRLVEVMVADGHEVAVHGFHHVRHDTLDEAASLADVRACAEMIKAFAPRPRWFRPPYGRPSAGAHAAAMSEGLELVYWSAWGLDWENRSAMAVARTASRDLDDGGILLLHDAARYNRRPSAEATARALPEIILDLRRRGIEPRRLGDVVGQSPQ